MQMLSDFHFIRPYGLLLVPLVAGLWWLWQRRTQPLRGWQQQMAPHLLEALTVGNSSAHLLSGRLLLSAWLLAALAIAGPTWRLEPSPFADDATPLLILLKADESMSPPGSAFSGQLERARMKIADLAAARSGQPLGLIAYAGSAHLVLPPTRDTAVVSSMAKEISPEIMPEPGDRLDLALDEAVRVLNQGQQGGSIVIIADSVHTDPATLKAWSGSHTLPMQFLALCQPGSSEERRVVDAASLLGAQVEPLDVEGKDIAEIIRRAAKPPVARQGGESGRRQDAGYALVPVIALLMLASFRRTKQCEVVS